MGGPGTDAARTGQGMATPARKIVTFLLLTFALSTPLYWLIATAESIQAIFTPLTGATALTPYVIDEFGIGLALAAVAVGYLFWRARAALSPAAALHP